MDLLQRVLECKEEEVDSIIEEAIKQYDSSTEIWYLGFTNDSKSKRKNR